MVPAAIAVTNPVFEIVAIELLEDVHGFTTAAVAVPVNGEVCPTQAFKVPLIMGFAFTVIVKADVVAHCPAAGVNVYVVVFVLSNAGDQVPVIPLLEVVGNAASVPPAHIGAIAVNVGVTIGFTTIVSVVAIAHPPLAGVKV